MGHKLKNPTVTRLCPTIVTAFLMIMSLLPTTSYAHGVAGQRFFPTTFAVDDPFISDEFSVLYNYIKMNDLTGGPKVQSSSFDVGYSKRITPSLGIEVDEQYQHLHTENDGTASGFGNVGVNLKYQFYTSAEHETILSVGVGDEIGNTGARQVGSESFSVISPAFYFGKGFGDLPESVGYLRPFAITGVFGPNIPSDNTTDGMLPGEPRARDDYDHAAPPGRFGPDVESPVLFPVAGIYAVFGQVKHGGRVLLFKFMVDAR